jgi:hypothetical protein
LRHWTDEGLDAQLHAEVPAGMDTGARFLQMEEVQEKNYSSRGIHQT